MGGIRFKSPSAGVTSTPLHSAKMLRKVQFGHGNLEPLFRGERSPWNLGPGPTTGKMLLNSSHIPLFRGRLHRYFGGPSYWFPEMLKYNLLKEDLTVHGVGPLPIEVSNPLTAPFCRMKHDLSFLPKQESRFFMPPKSPAPGLVLGQDGISHQGRGELVHSAKCYENRNPLRGKTRL